MFCCTKFHHFESFLVLIKFFGFYVVEGYLFVFFKYIEIFLSYLISHPSWFSIKTFGERWPENSLKHYGKNVFSTMLIGFGLVTE